MSMNIYITANRKITFKKKNGKRSGEVQTIAFNAWQTPTAVTRAILASANPAAAYIEWVKTERSFDEEWPVFAEDDIWCDGDPIRVEIVNDGKEHIEQFIEWCDHMEEKGFTIKFEEM